VRKTIDANEQKPVRQRKVKEKRWRRDEHQFTGVQSAARQVHSSRLQKKKRGKSKYCL